MTLARHHQKMKMCRTALGYFQDRRLWRTISFVIGRYLRCWKFADKLRRIFKIAATTIPWNRAAY